MPISAYESGRSRFARSHYCRRHSCRRLHWTVAVAGNRPQTSTGYSRTESGHGELVDTAQVTVRLEEDGSFLIAGGGPSREATGEMSVSENNDRNDGCNGAQPTRTRNMMGTYRPSGPSANIHGKVNPNSDTLKGELTRVERSPAAHTIITHVYRWDLRR